MTDQLPCINCLTLAICKARIIYLLERYGPTNRSLVSHLTQKCSLIYYYTYNTKCHKGQHHLKAEKCSETVTFLLSKGTYAITV